MVTHIFKTVNSVSLIMFYFAEILLFLVCNNFVNCRPDFQRSNYVNCVSAADLTFRILFWKLCLLYENIIFLQRFRIWFLSSSLFYIGTLYIVLNSTLQSSRYLDIWSTEITITPNKRNQTWSCWTSSKKPYKILENKI